MKNYIIISDLPMGFEKAAIDYLERHFGTELSPNEYEYFRLPNILSLSAKPFFREIYQEMDKNISLKGAVDIILIHYYNSLDLTDEKNPNLTPEKVRNKIAEKHFRARINFVEKGKKVLGIAFEQNEMLKETHIEGIYEIPYIIRLLEELD